MQARKKSVTEPLLTVQRGWFWTTIWTTNRAKQTEKDRKIHKSGVRCVPTGGENFANILKVLWCRGTESNCRHQPFQGCALPTELPRHSGRIREGASVYRITVEKSTFIVGWRRGRDLNPRQGFWPCDGLANRCLRPLGHLSALPYLGSCL